MRVTSPASEIKDIWDALTAAYGAAGTYGLLIETNLDSKVSLAKADVSALALEASLTTHGTDIAADIAALITAYLNHGTHGLPALETLSDEIETYLKHYLD